MFPDKNGWRQGDVLSLLLFNFASDYAIRRVQVNQDGLKLNGTRRLLVYADNINILGRSLPTIKENTEALVVASKEIELEVTAVKTSTWSGHEIRMQDEVTISRLKIVPLRGRKSSNI
jgi:hypothetical protein